MGVIMKLNRKYIIDMSAKEARTFLLKPSSYVTIQLPEYFSFEVALKSAKNKLRNRDIEHFINKKKLVNDEDANYTILLNKDGSYDWRPIQIIHPLLYVDLVNFITEEENWNILQNRFISFRRDKRIECISIPVESTSEKSDTAETILNWWEGLEQNSIVRSLQFSYCIKTDVTNCYGSIYTHTIDWSVRGKEEAKKDQSKNSFGAKLDSKIRQLQCNQTNGIPQGGVLFDFIAEIVLGYADLLLSEKLSQLKLSDWKIIRYRDDYRIFSNKKEEAEIIVKELSDVLSMLNMHFNSKKTKFTENIIEEAIKPDKRYWNSKIPVIMVKKMDNKTKGNKKRKEYIYHLSLQKHLLEILWLAHKYPNSGSLKKALGDFSNRLDDYEAIDGSLPLISIVANIISNNPTTIPSGMGVISRLLSKENKSKNKSNEQISKIVNQIDNKLESTPNLGFLQIWLQRISLLTGEKYGFKEGMCETVIDDSVSIWDSSWIIGKYKTPSIVLGEKIDSLLPEIPKSLFDVFDTYDA